MTTLIVWKSARKTSEETIYFASDSRISWTNSAHKWDRGRKLFYCKNHPIIFGFAGDALALSMAISVISDTLDCIDPCELALVDVPKIASQMLNDATSVYPRDLYQETEVLIAFPGDGPAHTIIRLQKENPSSEWEVKPVDTSSVDVHSNFIAAFGSGAKKFRAQLKRNQKDPQSGTARFVFWNFLDFVNSGKDPRTGGNIQIIRLGFDGRANPVGLLYNEKFSILGAQLASDRIVSEIDWRNEKFEFVGPKTGVKLPGQSRYEKSRPNYSE